MKSSVFGREWNVQAERIEDIFVRGWVKLRGGLGVIIVLMTYM